MTIMTKTIAINIFSITFFATPASYAGWFLFNIIKIEIKMLLAAQTESKRKYKESKNKSETFKQKEAKRKNAMTKEGF